MEPVTCALSKQQPALTRDALRDGVGVVGRESDGAALLILQLRARRRGGAAGGERQQLTVRHTRWKREQRADGDRLTQAAERARGPCSLATAGREMNTRLACCVAAARRLLTEKYSWWSPAVSPVRRAISATAARSRSTDLGEPPTVLPPPSAAAFPAGAGAGDLGSSFVTTQRTVVPAAHGPAGASSCRTLPCASAKRRSRWCAQGCGFLHLDEQLQRCRSHAELGGRRRANLGHGRAGRYRQRVLGRAARQLELNGGGRHDASCPVRVRWTGFAERRKGHFTWKIPACSGCSSRVVIELARVMADARSHLQCAAAALRWLKPQTV